MSRDCLFEITSFFDLDLIFHFLFPFFSPFFFDLLSKLNLRTVKALVPVVLFNISTTWIYSPWCSIDIGCSKPHATWKTYSLVCMILEIYLKIIMLIFILCVLQELVLWRILFNYRKKMWSLEVIVDGIFQILYVHTCVETFCFGFFSLLMNYLKIALKSDHDFVSLCCP